MFEFCLPTGVKVVPDGPDWTHEIKYDGLRVDRDGERVRLITRGGYDWTKQYPWIIEAARKVRQKRFVLDGEASSSAWTASPISTRCTPASTTRKSSFALSIISSKAATICASCRCRCARPTSNGSWRAGRREAGPDLFVAACRMGLEGLVSKRRDRPYQAGRSKHWIKVKNRKHPAMSRVMDFA
jgi:ATP-dependent DNA ligase